MKQAGLATLAYALLTVLFTWPLPYFFSTHHVGELAGDARVYLWNYWWVKKAVVELHTSPLRTDYSFYPVGIGLALHTLALLQGLVFIPVSAVLGTVAAANLIVCGTFVASALAVYALCRRLGAAAEGAFLAGVAFAFCPYRLARLAGHYDLLSTEWLPLYALAFIGLLGARETWPRWAVAAGVVAAACGYANLSYLVFLVLFSLLSAAWAVANQSLPPRALAVRGVLAAAIAAALLLPLLVQARRDLTSGHTPPLPGTRRYVADVAAYARPSPASTLFGPRLGRAFDPDLTDTTVFPGYVLLAAGLAAVADRRVRKGAGFWILLGTTAFVLSLGPSLRVAGSDLGVPMPFAALQRVPLLQHLRAPSRFSILVVLALAVLAARGWTRWGEGVSRTWLRVALTTAVAAAMTAECLAVPVPLFRAGAPALFDRVAAEAGDFTVVEVPGLDQAPARILYDQTVHGKRVLIGTAARVPLEKRNYFFGLPLVRPLIDMGRGRLEADGELLARERAAAPKVARFLALRYVVVEREAAARGVTAFLEQVLPVTAAEDDGERVLLRVRPEALPPNPSRIEAGSAESRMHFEDGWTLPSTGPGPAARSPSGARSTLLFRRPSPGPLRVVLEADGAPPSAVRLGGRRLKPGSAGAEPSWILPDGPPDAVERLEITWPVEARPPAPPPRLAAVRFEPAG